MFVNPSGSVSTFWKEGFILLGLVFVMNLSYIDETRNLSK